jgi:site-specific DNA-methyltransferase (adenine-specific)
MSIKWHTEKRKLADLIPATYNPRKLSDEQKKQLNKSLTKFGYVETIDINTDNTVIGGHQRLKVLADLGYDEIEVRVPERKLTKKEEKELNLRLNKNLGEFDYDLLGNGEFEIELLEDVGFDAEELESIFPDELGENEVVEDEPPAVDDVEPIAKLGDLWQLGRHRLLCADCTVKENVELLMDGKKADMIFADPPYGVNYTSRVDKNKRKPWGEIINDNLEDESLRNFLYDSLCFKDIAMYVCCNWQSYINFYLALGKPSNVIIWDKESIGLGSGYRQQHEFILFFGKLDHNSETNVWKLKRDSTIDYNHPTQKPVGLPWRAIKNSSKKDMIVYDPFLGSGSTLIACQQTDRICYGMELEPAYVSVVIIRWLKFMISSGKENEIELLCNGNAIDYNKIKID